jgi:hypothetical protein
MKTKQAVTAAEAGLSAEEQIKIALQGMIKNGGKALMEEIYQSVEEQMNGYVLSSLGKASLRSFINRNAVNENYLHPYDDGKAGWYITPKGRGYIEASRESEDYEEEEILSDQTDDSSISNPYDPSLIDVDVTPFTVFQIMRKIKLGEIDLQPDFQRLLVWDKTRQSRLIESILIRLPLPAFYLDAVNDDCWLVIDGLQRLSTLDKFCNKNKLRLQNLEFVTELEGKTFNELPRKYQRRIEDTKLNVYTIQPGTPSEVKFTIFSRINTGGLVLTAQEIRHALFQGKSTGLLKKLASSEEFKSATTNSIKSKRMDDRESILRFFAFHLKSYKEYRHSDFHRFLSDTMRSINDLSQQKISELEETFLGAMRKAKAIFGPYAFRRMYTKNGKRYPISKALFEIWSVSLVDYDLDSLIKYREEIVNEFIKIMNEDYYFDNSISQGTGSRKKVYKRFRTIKELLARVVR